MPDDFHLHLRDGAMLSGVIHHTTERFARAIAMPNLKQPVLTTNDAKEYRERILSAAGKSNFEPLMTLYLTEETTPDEIRLAKKSGIVHGVKLYPSGATTNSQSGVRDMSKVQNTFKAMEEVDLPLLIHAEVTDPDVDIFDKENAFQEKYLRELTERYTRLRIVFEHITTKEAVDFVMKARPGVAATITPHHLLMNRNAIFAGGIRPHNYCLPVLKREEDRVELVKAATSGNPKFFAGTDSAPHEKSTKEHSCGCAGIYNSHAAIELYAEVFDTAGSLQTLSAFLGENGARFYGLPLNTGTMKLVRQESTVPEFYEMGGMKVVPMRAGEKLKWKILETA